MVITAIYSMKKKRPVPPSFRKYNINMWKERDTGL